MYLIDRMEFVDSGVSVLLGNAFLHLWFSSNGSMVSLDLLVFFGLVAGTYPKQESHSVTILARGGRFT